MTRGWWCRGKEKVLRHAWGCSPRPHLIWYPGRRSAPQRYQMRLGLRKAPVQGVPSPLRHRVSSALHKTRAAETPPSRATRVTVLCERGAWEGCQEVRRAGERKIGRAASPCCLRATIVSSLRSNCWLSRVAASRASRLLSSCSCKGQVHSFGL